MTIVDICAALKFVVMELNYPKFKGIPIEIMDIHSLRGGEGNTLSLGGYSDREI